ncbi:heparan-alpha-glucosaminide N-acetyltransferase domain-containing protein [Georgenia yuyongxinii]
MRSAGTRKPSLSADRGTGRPGRLTGLDWARGLVVLVLVGTESVLAPRPAPLVHAQWTGVTAYDLIFPLFVLLAGCGMALAHQNAVPFRRTARQVLVLLLAGLAYNVATAAEITWATFRVTGPLQVFAGLVLVVALLHRVVRTAGGWGVLTVLAAVVSTASLTWWTAGCGGELTPGCNPSRTMDGALLGAHMYAQGTLGHDPEGVVAVAGAFVTAAAGVTAGHLIARHRWSRAAPLYLLAWAAGCFGTGIVLAQWVEPMKRLWTPSFALSTAAAGILLVAVGLALHDLPAAERWAAARARLAAPFVAVGRNSLLVYFGSSAVLALLQRGDGEPSAAARIADAVTRDGDPRLEFALLSVAAWWLLALVLHRWRIYVRA